jgi:low temperature requirement protein LtrA
VAERTAHLRPQEDGAAEVRPIGLFYDLVYVLAVTQLTRHLLANLTVRGALETAILLLAVWGAWNQIVWITNHLVFTRAFTWWIPTCSLFIAGGILTGDARIVVWLIPDQHCSSRGRCCSSMRSGDRCHWCG